MIPLLHGQEALGLYWGDFHNHCAVGLFHFAKGSLERAIHNVRIHWDFFSFTGHSPWHDMPAVIAWASPIWVQACAP